MTDGRITAAPEAELAELRNKQRADKAKVGAIQERMKLRQREIAQAREDKEMLARLKKNSVRNPLMVITEADRASSEADVPLNEFRAMALVVLKKETGLPQRNVFGCDHGPQGGKAPFCGDPVTHETGTRFVRALHNDHWSMMNGVGWTQTTWYEKVFRVERLSPDLTSPSAHMRVCFGDLALLRDQYGVAEAFRRYNGAGAAAEEYSRVCMSWLSGMKRIIGD